MFCPNCGANNSTEQKFCRSCGLRLEKIVETLLEQLPTAQNANLLRQEKLINRFGTFALGGFGVMLVLAVTAMLFWLVRKLIVTGTDVFAGALLVGFIVFAFLSLIFVIFNENLKEKKAKINSALNNNEPPAAERTGKLLEPGFSEPASVTENTTELLYAPKKRRTTDELA